MNQTSSNTIMPKSTAETLKQIQKQGLSISIVSPDSARSSFTLDTPVSKETKPIVTIDKTPKLPTRSSVATESKATISQIKSVANSSAEVRTVGGQSTSQSSFQDAKIPGSITKSVNPSVTGSETRAFGSQSWSKSVLSGTTENKTQGTSNLVVQPENKTPGGAVRNSQNSTAFSENKVQNTRIVPNISQVTDNKSQSRVSQITTLSESKNQGNQSRNQSQLTFEGKLQTGQGRVSISSPPLEVKTVNFNQGRSSQNFSAFIHENKSSGGQRTINPMLSNNQSKLNQNRSTEIKTPNPVRVTQAVKNTLVEKLRPNVSDQSSAISERVSNNPFRVSLGKKQSASEEKSLVKITRVSQNVSVMSENQSSTQSKISQNMSMHSESKAVSQVVKVSSVSCELSQKSPVSFDNSTNNSTPVVNTMSAPRGAAKRLQTARVTNSTPVAKKKCTKRSSPSAEAKRLQNIDISLSSEDGSPKDQQFFNMKGLTPGLTITPVGGSAASNTNPSTSANTVKATVAGTTVPTFVSCPSCGQLSVNLTVCDSCHSRIPSTAQLIRSDAPPSIVVTKNVTTSVQKHFYIQLKNHQQVIQHAAIHEDKVVIQTNQVTPRPKSTRGRARRKFEEPVCYTLSSDEEEPMQVSYHPSLAEAQPNFFAGDSEGSKSEHSSASEVLQDENLEFDDPQYPGVTDINEQVELEEEPEEEEEEMEFEGMREDEEIDESLEEEEEEEIPPEEPESDGVRGQKPTDYPLRCRSIRIGSYKIHPFNNLPYLPVTLSAEAISFRIPVLYDSSKCININLRSQDIIRVLVHFGRCLPIMFVFTTSGFGEVVRNHLRMTTENECYFDPTSKNDKIQRITFLIDSMSDEQRNFIRHCFPGDKKVKEIDQKEANEILVKSTPNQVVIQNKNSSQVTKLQIAHEQPISVQLPQQISAQKIMPPQPPQPVIKLLTYPPPPQTGGIAVTSEDLHCLNDGEFLNDAIIDFYLKYIFNEKLTPPQREKTHIFSSFFYPRLTHKPERPRPGEDIKNVQARRHNQVKTWTRHVDIFSKDFIIIPVNQNVHWFLAIICYPGKVPEIPESTSKAEGKSNKSSDNVSSTVEQEINTGSKVIIRELSNNGEGDSLNQDENSASSINSTYLVEEPPDSDEPSPEAPDSSTHPDGKQRKEMPCILLFDSLSGPNRWRIPATLREYLEMEWKMKKGTKKVFDRNTMQGFVMKCPQQTNFSDCGTYLLQFVESFFEHPIPYFGNPMPDLTNWFSESKISKKRQQLKELILNIHKKQVEIANARKVKPPDGVQVTPVTVQQTDNR